ncbi:MAG: FtsQ-type POTRA domain-containing protein, partial [Sphingomonadaceae bacterium]
MNRPAHIAASGVRVPAAPRRIWRLLFGLFGLLALVAVAVWLTVLGHPQRMLHALAVWSAGAGFSVRQVVVEGDMHQPRLPLYREVLSGGTDAMILLDLPDLRARIEALPWVREAHVRRRWPDTLIVTLVEREPIAIWQ